jgi:hypothetical protein
MPPRNHFADGVEVLIEFYSEMSEESDRTAAIVGASFLDDSLGFALTHRFIGLGKDWTDRLFDSANAPLGTFSAKIRLGYALGVFGPKTHADLDRIRRVRNEFAHAARRKSFADTVIANLCMALITPAMIPPSLGEPIPLEEEPRSRYHATCRHISGLLIAEVNASPPARPTASTRLL